MALTGVEGGDYYQAAEGLNRVFGSFDEQEDNWTPRRTSGSGPDEKSYVIEKRLLSDDEGLVIGSFKRSRNRLEVYSVQRIISAGSAVMSLLFLW